MANTRTRVHTRPNPIVYSIPDAAARIGTTPNEVMRAVKTGQLIARHFSGKSQAKILEEDLIEWFKSLPLVEPEALQ